MKNDPELQGLENLGALVVKSLHPIFAKSANS